MEIITKEERELNEAIEKSALPSEIDANMVNDILIDIRKRYYASI